VIVDLFEALHGVGGRVVAEPVTAWGRVVALTPTMMVRLRDGDVPSDVPVSLKNADVSLTVGDFVGLVRFGTQGWVVAFRLAAI
jgi:hypothetical protein